MGNAETVEVRGMSRGQARALLRRTVLLLRGCVMHGNSFANGTVNGGASQRHRWAWPGGYQATVPPSADLYQLTEWNPYA